MTDFNKDINPYTAKDFERYYAGQMTASEMHELEKSALDDPFLQDALEGFQFTRQGVTDIAALKLEVDQRIQQSKVVSFGPKEKTTALWKVAAMVLLTAGMGWLIYNVALDNKTKDIAVTEKPSGNTSATDEAGDTPSASTTTNATDEVNDATTTPASPTVSNKKTHRDQTEVSKKGTGNTTAPSVSSPAPERQAQPGILTQQEAPPPDVALQRSESSPVNADGTARKDEPPKENYSLSRRAKASESEKAVVGETPATAGIHKYPMSFEEAFPENGEIDYHQYVAKHIRIPLNERNEPVRGEVELSFDVNSQGRPVQIQVEKSLCKSCDAEAVRLLKEGPGWIQKAKLKKAKFSIRF
jgi:outer membrane biosynthesis protein TonB